MKIIITKPYETQDLRLSHKTYPQHGTDNKRILKGGIQKHYSKLVIGDLIEEVSDNLQNTYGTYIVTDKSVKQISGVDVEKLWACTHYGQCIHKSIGEI